MQRHSKAFRSIARWLAGPVSLVAAAGHAAVLAQVANGGDDVSVLQEFAEEVTAYAALRGELEAPLPAFDARADSWSVVLTRRYLASAIRVKRSYARQGDIFTPEVSDVLRDTIARAVRDAGIECLCDEERHPEDLLVDLAVNEPAPAWALEALPEPLRRALPPLPAGIEYRAAAAHLILWDAHAEILVDVLPDAFLPR